MIRQHQFQKVELVKFVKPEESDAEHEALTRHAETVAGEAGASLPADAALYGRYGCEFVEDL